jgi:signal transduction histidine kinase
MARLIKKRVNTKEQLAHITQEMYQRNKELADINRTLSLLRTIDTLVLESKDSIKLLAAQITDAIGTVTEYPLVAIYGPSSLGTDKFEAYGINTRGGLIIDKELLRDIKPNSKHRWYHSQESDQLLSVSHLSANQIAFYLGCGLGSAEIIKSGPIKSVFISRMTARQKLVGVILVGSTGPMGDFETADIHLLQRLTEAVGLALDNKLLFEENQQVLQQLKKANSRLRELDATKDEFISMASHQLRTPLTTIKGYLSMVLEGDVGPVTKKEKDMIRMAFDSAEHMVFLIADLLNISRLQSGKFLIQNKPTDLAKMIDVEVGQLKEAAENHHLTLSYKKPDNFPVVALDDTKIRQVIMNFMDNAIYYTPAEGTITVSLEATDAAINFTVTDTGLGVPKNEQSHLFKKFYRAGNARKIRPDGTGLGLFMAKKVVIAQGGAILFNSTEGKGSTFGFTFPRAKIEVKNQPAAPEPVAQAKAA